MPDNFTGNFPISINGATNPIMGANGQGVCGVTLNFDHEYLGDLQITLTSPSGQTVTLVGPIGFFGSTNGSAWNVTFVPCSQSASPDAGFANTFNNNQPWGMFGNYGGSYYPNGGCLETFTGPVNGTWNLSVVDGQANDVGNFTDYTITFCDPSGITCESCDAAAGNLPQPDVAACQFSPTLNLSLPPTYASGSSAPPAASYNYEYVIAGPNSPIISAYEPGPDLSGYEAGSYTVCGISYLASNQPLLPAPGATTIAALSAQLNGTNPPFCGKITSNCVNVTIKPVPPDEEVTESICAPNVFVFHGQGYSQSGTYVRNLTQAGCPYTATLNLTVNPRPIRNLSEVICDGGCATTPGFEGFCSSGVYTQTFQTAAGCDSIVNLNVSVLPVQAMIQPTNTLSCQAPATPLNGAGSTAGPGVTYQWIPSDGGVLGGPATSLLTTATAVGHYALLVCRSGPSGQCCDSTSVDVTGDFSTPASPGTVSGANQACTNQTVNFSVPPVSGATTYTWTAPTGVTITAGQGTSSITATWGATANGNICVTANNQCGASQPTCFPVTTGASPALSAITGNNSVCQNDVQTYSVPTVATATTYNWTVPANAQITSGQGTGQITVNWGTSTGGDVCCTATGSCGNSQPSCLAVTVGAPPATPNQPSLPSACAGSMQSYSITAATGVTYNWVVTNGTITAGQGTATIQVTWNNNAPSGTVCVTAVGSCGQSPQNCRTVTLTPAPPMPDIAGDSILCAGTVGSYLIPSIAGTTGYAWTVPTGATLVSGQNSTNATINWGNSTGGNVCVAANSGCGTGPQDCYAVTVRALPNANAGTTGSVCGLTINLGATTSVAGSTGTWSQVSGPGNTNFSNASAAATSITASANGTYVYRWIEKNGTCSDTATTTVHFNSSPQGGQVTPTCDNTNQNYTISFPITNGTGPYTVSGGTVSAGVFTSTAIVSGNTYTFSVADANGCTSQVVTGSHNCNCSTQAGTMTLMPLSACMGQNVTAQHNNNATLDANDIGNYILHTNSGTTLGQILGQNTTGVFAFQSPMQYEITYYISYVVGNNVSGAPSATDPCRSVAQGQPVVFHQNPTANAGMDAATCMLNLPINAATSTGFGTWAVVNSPSGATLSFNNDQSAATTATASAPGTYTLKWTMDNSGCTASDQVVLTFNESPQAGQLERICNNTNQNFTVTIPISNGTAPYTVNGAAVTGSSFTSAAINNNGTYTFNITDANGCTAPTISGSYNCNCATDAGTMSLQTATACEGSTVTALHNGDENLDGNDITRYYLHDGNNTILGQVFDENTTGIFGFKAGMVYGQTYYVSLVAGNSLTGTPDPSDPCISISQGQPVVFVKNPIPNTGIDAAICGQSIDLQATSVNGGVWTKVTGNGNATFANGNSKTTQVDVTTTGVYTFAWTETTVEGCFGSDTVQIRFNASPNAGTVDKTCDATNQNYTVTIPITGGTAPYQVNGTPVTGTSFTSNAIQNNVMYDFQITDANGCTAPALTGSFNCNCATDAGNMSLTAINACQGQTITAQHAGQNLDPNDIGIYILYAGNDPATGQILASKSTPTFSFDSLTMQYGQEYHIAYAIGNNVAGQPDPGDPCFGITQGQPVVWNPEVSATVVPTIEICNTTAYGSALNFSQLVTAGDLNGAWTGPSIGSGTFPNIDFNGANPGVYDYKYTTATAIAPCQNKVYTVKVTVNDCQCPPVTTTAPSKLCNANGTLNLASLQITSFAGTWSIAAAPPGPTPATINGATFNAANANAGDYNLVFTLDDTPPAGCPTSSAQTLTVENSVEAGTVGAPVELCEGQTTIVTLKNLLTNPDAGGQWTETSAQPSTNSAFSAGAGTFQTGNQKPGTYTFKYKVLGEDPCPDDEVTVTVIIHANPVADAGENKALDCTVSSATLGGNSSSGANFTYTWSLNGTAIPDATAANVNATQGGNYLLIVTNTATGCSATDAVSVLLSNDQPVGIIEPAPITCNGAKNGAIIIKNVTGGQPPYQYSLNDAPLGSNSLFSSLSADNYVVKIEDGHGCIWESAVITIAEPQEVVADLGTDLSIKLGDSVRLSVQISIPLSAVDTIIWKPLADTSAAGKTTQEVLPFQSQQYEVTVIDTNGCADRDVITVNVDRTRHVFIPNIFHPESDQNNNIFMIFGGKDVIEVLSFEVFDRWGERMFGDYGFQPNDPTHGWDGNYRSKKLNPGVYIYTAEILFKDGAKKLYKGDVTLER